jgi:hypothetical protein
MSDQREPTSSVNIADDSLAQRGLSNAGFTREDDECPATCGCRIERGHKLAQFSLPAYERGPPLPLVVIDLSLARALRIS